MYKAYGLVVAVEYLRIPERERELDQNLDLVSDRDYSVGFERTFSRFPNESASTAREIRSVIGIIACL